MTAETVEIPGYIAGTWDIDPVHSHVGFVARHLMLSKVRGNFTKVEGQIITADNPLESSATATIDMTSFNTGNEQRDGDVKGENFLDVANYPTMTYRTTGIRQDGEVIIADGELTIKGITRPVELAVEVNGFGPDPYGGTRPACRPSARSTAQTGASPPTWRCRPAASWWARGSSSSSRSRPR